MLNTYEVPLSPEPQSLRVQLGAVTYGLRVVWNAGSVCWTVDLYDASGELLAGGLPLVTGADLLGQLGHLGIPGCLIVQTDHEADVVPDFTNLGDAGKLFFITEGA